MTDLIPIENITNHLQELPEFMGIRIVSPKEFLADSEFCSIAAQGYTV